MRKVKDLLAELTEALEAQQALIDDQRLEIIGLKAEVSRLQRRNAQEEESAWETLGLEPGATAAEIKAAFKALSRRLHPDSPGGDAAAFQQLVAARDALLP
jgi:hypothetical protein